MNHDQVKIEVAKRETRIARFQGERDDHARKRAALQREYDSALRVDRSDAASLKRIEIALRDLDGEIQAVERRIGALQDGNAHDRAWLAAESVAERKRSAIAATECVESRCAAELTELAGAIEAWFADGLKHFAALDAIAAANRSDLHDAARVAFENASLIGADERQLRAFGSAIDLRLDSVLGRFLNALKIEQRVSGVDVPRPIGTPIGLEEVIEIHADRLSDLCVRLREKVEARA